jgi:hypothetical protein
MKCCILPPRTLYYPVLPFRCHGKLLFCLCRTCATEQNTDVCTHETVVDRTVIGSWVIDEIRLAVEKGYHLVEVYEVYENEVMQYDPATGQGNYSSSILTHFLN